MKTRRKANGETLCSLSSPSPRYNPCARNSASESVLAKPEGQTEEQMFEDSGGTDRHEITKILADSAAPSTAALYTTINRDLAQHHQQSACTLDLGRRPKCSGGRKHAGLDCSCLSSWCRELGYLESGCVDPEHWLLFPCTRAPGGGCFWDPVNCSGVTKSNFVKHLGGIRLKREMITLSIAAV